MGETTNVTKRWPIPPAALEKAKEILARDKARKAAKRKAKKSRA